MTELLSTARVQLFETPWTVAHQAHLFMEFFSKVTGVGCRALLQEIFPNQGLNPGLLHHRQILYHLSHQGSPGVHAKYIGLNLHDLELGKSFLAMTPKAQ